MSPPRRMQSLAVCQTQIRVSARKRFPSDVLEAGGRSGQGAADEVTVLRHGPGQDGEMDVPVVIDSYHPDDRLGVAIPGRATQESARYWPGCAH
jgi:hypothetical protein